MSDAAAPLTVGTAGHIDHGKTALVRALTGRDTDRLPEEQARGISIDLGFAQLDVGGRLLSLVDVPGHERFVRTMVAGASGVDLFLLVVAADDGVMPQTRRARRRAAGARRAAGVVAVTKSDLADPARAVRRLRELVGTDVPIVDCSARTGAGVEQVRAALGHVAARAAGRAAAARARPCCTSTARSRCTAPAPSSRGRCGRARSAPATACCCCRAGAVRACAACRCTTPPVERAAGGPARRGRTSPACGSTRSRRGDVVAGEDAGLRPAWILDVELDLGGAEVPRRAQIHHGTRETPARIADARAGALAAALRAAADRARGRPLRRALDRAARHARRRPRARPARRGARAGRRRPRSPRRAGSRRPPREPQPAVGRRARDRATACARRPTARRATPSSATARTPRSPSCAPPGRAVRLDRTMHIHREALDAVARPRRGDRRRRGVDHARAAARRARHVAPLRAGAARGARRRPGRRTRGLPDDRRILRRKHASGN